MFTLRIDTDNAALQDEEGPCPDAVAALVRKVAADVAAHGLVSSECGGVVMDANGNRVGSWRLTP